MQYIYRCTNNPIDSLSRAVSHFSLNSKPTQILGLFQSLLFCTRETRYNICTKVRSFCQGSLRKQDKEWMHQKTFSSIQLYTMHSCSSDYRFYLNQTHYPYWIWPLLFNKQVSCTYAKLPSKTGLTVISILYMLCCVLTNSVFSWNAEQSGLFKSRPCSTKRAGGTSWRRLQMKARKAFQLGAILNCLSHFKGQ